ncbi:MAG: hypothetical protein ACRD1Y_03095, partial [Terriglobales bacterium]
MPVSVLDLAGYRLRARHPESRPLCLLTDAAAPAELPAAVRAAADLVWLQRFPPAAVPAQPSSLTWRRGETLLAGTAEALRALATRPGGLTYVPVHYGAGSEWELVGLEPRGRGPVAPEAASAAANDERVELRVRIGAAPAPPPAPGPEEEAPWQRLQAALVRESAQASSGVAPLAELAQTPGLAPLLHALCLRNLVAMLARAGAAAEALPLLLQARQAHPQYRDLDY